MELVAPHGPAWVFFGVVAVIAVLPWLAERMRVPGIIGLLLGGLLLGQNGFGVVPEGDLVIPAVGHVGLLYLMFLAGVELDLAVLRTGRPRSARSSGRVTTPALLRRCSSRAADSPVPALIVFGEPSVAAVDVPVAGDALLEAVASLLTRSGANLQRPAADVDAATWSSRPGASSAVLVRQPSVAFLRAAAADQISVLGVWPAGGDLTTTDRAEDALSVVPGTGA